MKDFGELKNVSMSDMWPDEAHNFTPWLAENIDVLGNAIGLILEFKEKEARVGRFYLDILAEDVNSRGEVIIENQLTKTDHDHLGKLITYASGFDAYAIIWVADSFRDEHRQALEWLNQRTGAKTHFFAVVVEGLQIDDSKPAYKFKTIVFPEELQNLNNNKNYIRGEMYRSYYQPMIDELIEKHRFTTSRKAPTGNWCGLTSDISGVLYCAAFNRDIPRVEVYFTSNTKIDNKALFDILKTKEQTIEERYGQSFEWLRQDGTKVCYIQLIGFGGKLLSDMTEEEKDEVRRWHISNLLKMKEVFTSFIEQALQGN